MPYDRTKYITRTPEESLCFDFMAAQSGFLADYLFTPKVLSGVQRKIYQADNSKLRKVIGKFRGTNSTPPLVDEQFFSTNVTLSPYKYGREIDPVDERDADAPVRPMLGNARAAALCTLNHLIEVEAEAVTLATTTANYNAANTSAIASGSRWNEAGGDPESDSVTAHQALKGSCGMRANALAIGDQTLDKIRLSPYFRERTKYTGAGKVPIDYIKAMFDVQNIFVGDARYDSGIEGGTASIGGFWSDYAIMFVYNPSPAIAPSPGAVSYGHMYTLDQRFWTSVVTLDDKQGPAGPMRRLDMGSELALGAGMVMGDGDGDFAAGYLFRTVVA
jgi:hypothetical protein